MCSSQTAVVRVDIFRMLAACNKCINQQGNLLVGLTASGACDGTVLWVSQCVEWQFFIG
jgi:hypothetical protein